MRLVAGFSVFFVLIGFPGFAQTALPSANSTIPDAANVTCNTSLVPGKDAKDGKGTTATVCRTAMVPACPLGMHVGQRAGGTLMATDDQGRRVKMFAARLSLELKDLRPDRTGRHMVSATVTVRGWNPKPRAVPLDSDGSRNGNLVRTMTVPLTGGGLPDASADLELPGFTAARVVELESITYDDGQVWDLSGAPSCRVAPDLYMPVDRSN